MNLLDSSGWIEFFAGAPNAVQFAPIVSDLPNLLVPTIVLHEVFRWAEREGGESAAKRAMTAMKAGMLVGLNAELAITSARLARRHRLPTADSIVYASAQSRGAIVWIQDADFADLPDVRYFPKVKQDV